MEDKEEHEAFRLEAELARLYYTKVINTEAF